MILWNILKKDYIVLKKITTIAPLTILALSVTACSHNPKTNAKVSTKKQSTAQVAPQKKSKPYAVKTAVFKPRRAQPRRSYKPRPSNNSFTNKLSNAALGRLKHRVRYDGSYVKIGYPWGDVPANIGVCTDVVIRSYRNLGIDLQQQVHKDMSYSFNSYPNVSKWGLSKPDKNIDHRRVYNLGAFFKRQGAALPVTRNPRDYKPGDLVTWMVGPNLPHIGVVVNKRSKADPRRYMIVHNIANGPEMEDILFRFPVTGHYRYTPSHMNRIPTAKQRMVASNSRRTNYNQLVNDAARIMKLHGNSAPQRTANKNNHQVVAINKNTGNSSSKKNAPQNITLAQANVVNLTNSQLSDLLKK